MTARSPAPGEMPATNPKRTDAAKQRMTATGGCEKQKKTVGNRMQGAGQFFTQKGT
ncbi:hypothetical protein [Larkinella humicola]|uniref:hypothetical protein n=1 Tax=Larkinella humicola TaxID=2607654 RepID=UPI0017803C2D|nr:hypothetical protein [Larkinella humicola]